MTFDIFDEDVTSKYSPRKRRYELDMRDLCALEPYVMVVKNKGIVCTDGRTRYYVESVTYDETQGFIFTLSEDE